MINVDEERLTYLLIQLRERLVAIERQRDELLALLEGMVRLFVDSYQTPELHDVLDGFPIVEKARAAIASARSGEARPVAFEPDEELLIQFTNMARDYPAEPVLNLWYAVFGEEAQAGQAGEGQETR